MGLVLRSECGIARDGKKAPALRAGFQVVRGHIAPCAGKVTASVTEYHDVTRQQRRTG